MESSIMYESDSIGVFAYFAVPFNPGKLVIILAYLVHTFFTSGYLFHSIPI